MLEEVEINNDAENEMAQCDLEYNYQNEIGAKRDEIKAFEHDECIGKDLEKVIYWYNKAAAENGNTEKDEIKAFEYFKKSVEKGYNEAQITFALLYENGKD